MDDPIIFKKVLDPEDSSAGGGSAAALSGAMAGALIAMLSEVCANSAQVEETEFFKGVSHNARELSNLLLAGAARDSQAFQAVRIAYKLPKTTDAEKQVRSQTIQTAWVNAARIPLVNASNCLLITKLGENISRLILPAVHSDLVCAALLARAGFSGCLENLAINLPLIKDPQVVSDFSGQATALLAQMDSLPPVELNSFPA
jgi:methenyltetrahydrofolate cyclohydrolase